MGHRRRQMLGETRLLMEYLAQAYPDDRWLTNVKLGTDLRPRTGVELTEKELRMLRVYKRYADAIVIQPGRVIVIEAAIWKAIEKVGPLLQYLALVPHTAELQPFLDRQVVGELMVAVTDAVADKLCRDHGIRYTVFAPPWLEEFFSIYPGRKRTAPAPGTIEL